MRLSCLNQIILSAGLLLAMILNGAVMAASSHQEEYSVKAALVYNFVRFVEWPDEVFEQDPEVIQIVVFGDENLLPVFKSIEGSLVGVRRISVVFAEKPEDVRGCHLLFLAKTEREDWPQIKAALGEEPVLTVGEMNGFLESGGIINLHLENKRIRFQINLDQARENNILISSRILKLATSVINENREKK